jgi:hypothetical protein
LSVPDVTLVIRIPQLILFSCSNSILQALVQLCNRVIQRLVVRRAIPWHVVDAVEAPPPEAVDLQGVSHYRVFGIDSDYMKDSGHISIDK